MLKLDLILQIMNQIGPCLMGKKKEVIGLIKNELDGKTMKNILD